MSWKSIGNVNGVEEMGRKLKGGGTKEEEDKQVLHHLVIPPSKKIKKPKSQTRKDVIFGSSRVVSPLNRALYITPLGCVNSLTLGAILVSLILSPPTG